jgi:predicted nucleic acid-binding protein
VIVVDTTILVYASGDVHPLRDDSLRLFEAIADGRIEGTTTVEVIQEFVHVRARRQSRAEAAKSARAFADLLAPLLVASDLTVDDGLRIFEQHDSLGGFDAFLAANAIAGKADALVSADRAFSSVSRLTHIAPGTAEFERLLAA